MLRVCLFQPLMLPFLFCSLFLVPDQVSVSLNFEPRVSPLPLTRAPLVLDLVDLFSFTYLRPPALV